MKNQRKTKIWPDVPSNPDLLPKKIDKALCWLLGSSAVVALIVTQKIAEAKNYVATHCTSKSH